MTFTLYKQITEKKYFMYYRSTTQNVFLKKAFFLFIRQYHEKNM